jgi:hypothetical protein
MTGQSVRHSWFEAVANVAVGFCIGLASNILVMPCFGVKIDLVQSAYSSVVFTFISLARSFAMRRLFNWLHLRQATRLEAAACMHRSHGVCHSPSVCRRGGCVFDKE